MSLFSNLKSKLGVHSSGGAGGPSRNDAMVEEVRRFAQEIKLFHAEYNALSKETQKRFTLVSGMLGKMLPRTFDNGAGGATPTSPEQRIGLTIDVAGIENARAELERRLQQDVMANLEKWISDYRDIKAHHRENLKLLGMLNDQRKTVASLQEKYQKQKAVNHKDLDTTWNKCTAAEQHSKDLQQQYVQKEKEIFDVLTQLIRRSALFKDGIALALGIFQGAYTSAYAVFEESANGIGATPVPGGLPAGAGAPPPPYSAYEPKEEVPGGRASAGAPGPADYNDHMPVSPPHQADYPPHPQQPVDYPPHPQQPTDYPPHVAAAPYPPPEYPPSHQSQYPSTMVSAPPAPQAPVAGPTAQEQGSTTWYDSHAPTKATAS